MKLFFTVEQQKLKRTNTEFIANNSRNYLECEFTFGTDWEDITDKYAVFHSDKGNTTVVIENNVALVPHDIIGHDDITSFIIGVFGTIPDKDISTNFVSVVIAKGAYLSEDEIGNPEEQQSLYQQAVDMMEEMEVEHDEIQSDLDDHEQRITDIENSGGADTMPSSKVNVLLGESINTTDTTQDQVNITNADELVNHDQRIVTNETNLSNHMFTYTNPHQVTKTQVGLDQVDNTSDASKPISNATQTALNGKANTVHTHLATEITQDTNHRFVTDAEKAQWNAASGGGEGGATESILLNITDPLTESPSTTAATQNVVNQELTTQGKDFETRISAIEDGGGTPVDAYTKAERDSMFLNKQTGGEVSGNFIFPFDSKIRPHSNGGSKLIFLNTSGTNEAYFGKCEPATGNFWIQPLNGDVILNPSSGKKVIAKIDSVNQEVYHTGNLATAPEIVSIETELDLKAPSVHSHAEYALLAHAHVATDVTTDPDHLFVTQAEKDTWNAGTGGEPMTDADTLDGHDSLYFATQTDMDAIESTVGQNTSNIADIALITSDHETRLGVAESEIAALPSHWEGSQSSYDALGSYDSNTYYSITS